MFTSLLLAIGCLACVDRNPAFPTPSVPTGQFSAQYQCEVDTSTGSVQCREESPNTGAVSPALLGQNQIKMASANGSYDSSSLVYQFDATVQNLLPYPIGTPDGSERTGVKVFFETGPTVSEYHSVGDTGTVTIANADGIQSFNAANQSYFFYDTILAPQGISAPRQWRYLVPLTVKRFRFTVRAFAFTVPETEIPMHRPNGWLISPDSVASLYSFSKTVLSHPRLSGPYPRSIVLVGFQQDATREERQSAVNMIGGSVIGGLGRDYVVVIPDAGTAGPLWSAVDRLRALPQVHHASPDIFTQGVGGAYLRPHDGPGWAQSDWALVVDSAEGLNWGPEAVAAPFGWGCETGDAAARIAVVDTDPMHGGRVLSVITTPANDSADIAGMMWNGSFSLRTNNLLASLDSAFADSAHVINLSVGAMFIDTAASAAAGYIISRVPQNTTADIQRAADYADQLSQRLDEFEFVYGIEPLYVLAAGNNDTDASLSGFPQLGANPDFSARVLVVGASSRGDSTTIPSRVRPRWTGSPDPRNPGSSNGPLVTMMAPGGDIQLMSSGVPYVTSGTSYAAPMVAAAAGLLKSFDSRLGAAEIRVLLLEGAQRGGWTSNGVLHLNVYEALKAAARRAGAPLCGQRYWIQGGTFVVQRDSASDQRETLFTIPGAFLAGGQNVMHGGKHIYLYNRGEKLNYRWSPAGWAPGVSDGYGYPQPGSNAATLSRDLTSHDRDRYAGWATDQTATSVTYTMELYDTLFTTVTPLAPLTFPLTRGAQQCIQEFVSVHPDDDARLRTGDSATAKVYLDYLDMKAARPCEVWTGAANTVTRRMDGAFSPRGDALYAIVGTNLASTTVQAWATCGKEGTFYGPGGAPAGSFQARVNMKCRGWAATSSTGDTEVWRLGIANNTSKTKLPWGAQGARLNSASIGENLREITVEVDAIQRSQNGWWEQSGDYSWTQKSSTAVEQRSCRLEFRRLDTGAVTFQAPVTCRADGGDAGFTPSRSPRP